MRIIEPSEHIREKNIAVIELLGYKDKKGFPLYLEGTPLVVELHRQVFETNKDLEDIHPGCLGRSTDKHDVPKNACFVAWSKKCGEPWYVCVCPEGLREFEEFTLKILNFSGWIKESTVSGATGVKLTSSGSQGAAR